MPAFLSQFLYILFYVNETWNGSFLHTVDRIHAIHINSVIVLCLVGLEIPIDAQRNITDLTIAYSFSSFVMLDADNTPLFLDDISVCWRHFSWKAAFLQPLDDVLNIAVI
jgi:hypothetical protein